jgi:uncharacterized membrane protein
MKAGPRLALAGLLLIAAGVFVLAWEPTYTKERSVVNLGDFHASVEEKHPVPAWLGVASVAGGVMLLAAGLRRRPDGTG